MHQKKSQSQLWFWHYFIVVLATCSGSLSNTTLKTYVREKCLTDMLLTKIPQISILHDSVSHIHLAKSHVIISIYILKYIM